MNSLKIKILGLTAVLLVLTLGLSAWQNLHSQKSALSQVITQDSQLLGETVRNVIIAHMTNGQSIEVPTILEKIHKEPAFETVRIFDETGRILISAQPEEIGDSVPTAEFLGFRSGKPFISKKIMGKEYHVTLLPIHNTQACHSCHEPARQVLGVLNMHLSMSALDPLRDESRSAALTSSAVMLLVLMLSITLFILVYVDLPIRKLVAGMQHLEQGDFEHATTAIDSSAEMSLLSSKFNQMVDRLKSLIETKLRQEKEITVSQEKLAYHEEIHNMNLTLEERLREIEYLNTTLESRIEEIESANLKIADLAGDLEAKNTTLRQAVTRLSALNEMGLTINSARELETLFPLLIKKTLETLQAQAGYILLLGQNPKELRLVNAVGLPERQNPGAHLPPRAVNISHRVIEDRKPLLITSDDQLQDAADGPFGFTNETVICAPLVIKAEVIGTITITNKTDMSSFTNEDLDLLSTISNQASVAIYNVRLYREQQNTYLNTVQALVSAIEASDAYTSGHSERVTRYSLALARHLGMRQAALRRLEQAAILHDVGKIGIAIELLHKKGVLSEEDVGLLQQHPVIGVRILEPIEFLDGVRDIIAQHHERYDGAGYPYGLRGEELLIEARILAVADTYDAMTSDRPYRSALSHQTALLEIESQAWAQFDPRVAKSFIDLFRDTGMPKTSPHA
ncbi:MAG: hypothetical protein C0617_05345 [Desulfuromonas sp.]|uniref:HD domain-containing phosphohydrolase n=1 Tax=Desulfuromonas sp. TaxID=892 RepID=UPI000CAC546E|nr:HD domain-containing phosphohydrolase [Desulfuromonas sp.]PLX85114.1 MAG: hypothetical protein C0617_05345 [Desulfuromonas sp.]